MTELRSPETGQPLIPVSEHLLRDHDGRLWPLLDGIPFLRIGRDDLIERIIARLKVGDRESALVVALGDQDDWWTGPLPDAKALQNLVRERDRLSLREAMDLLSYGRVAQYFAHRWSDPTFLSGLALLETHWKPATSAFELACGIGHFGRELTKHGVAYTGGDVVFSKLWLARHWVVPAEASLICFDAGAPWPIADERYDLTFCHDAFYFLEPKAEIAKALRTLASAEGRVVVGHIHNSDTATLSAGHAMSADDIANLFPDATVYDDAELTQALAEGRVPRSAQPCDLRHVEAFSVEDRAAGAARAVVGGLALPARFAPLRLNPLYHHENAHYEVVWPSQRYETEYARLSTYPSRLSKEDVARATRHPDAESVRRRLVVDLPDRW